MPIRKIIVGVDLSPESAASSEVAARRAAEIAAQHGAELVVVHAAVVPERPEVPPSMQAVADTYVAVLTGRLAEDRRGLADLRERLSAQGVTVSQVLVDRHADEALVEAATELGADLVVTGARDRGRLRRWLLGSVAEHVVRAAPVSVLVARAGDPDRGFERIVVGTDFSEPADRAVTQAVELARPGATIHLVHCLRTPLPLADEDPDVSASYAEMRRVLIDDAQHSADRVIAAHAAAPVTFSYQLALASPREGVCDFAEEHAADLVVVGSHGHRGVRRVILGSVAEAVVRHAPCSVLVAR